MDIGAGDLSGPITTRVAPALQDRVNKISLTLDQSKEHDWSETALLDYTDMSALGEDQELLEKDLGSAAFINSPIRAAAMQVTQLRRARAHQLYTLPLLLPSDDMTKLDQMLDLKLLDVIQVTETTEHGFTDKLMRIAKVTESQAEGLSRIIECEEYNPNFYADTLQLPPKKPRVLAIAEPNYIFKPINLTVTSETEVQGDGAVLSFMVATWLHQLAGLEFQYRIVSADDSIDYQSRVSEGDSLRIQLPPGTYEYRARHYSTIDNGIVSDWTDEATIVLEGDARALAAPSMLTAHAYYVGYELRWAAPTEDYYGITLIQQHNGTDWVRVGSVMGSNFIRTNQGGGTAIRARIAHRSKSGIQTAWSAEVTTTTLDAILGADGQEGPAGANGLGVEYIFALATEGTTAIAANQLPLNSWGFDQPATVNGRVWMDGADLVNLTSTESVLFRAERPYPAGIAVGDTVAALWSTPAIVGHFGQRWSTRCAGCQWVRWQ